MQGKNRDRLRERMCDGWEGEGETNVESRIDIYAVPGQQES